MIAFDPLHFVRYFLIAAIGLLTPTANASITYSYIGNNFTKILDADLPIGSYDTTMSLRGSFAVADPLLSLPQFTDISALLLSYTFSDGRQILNNFNSTISFFTMQTDSTGRPLDWAIDLRVEFEPLDREGTLERRIFSDPGTGGDFGTIEECTVPGFVVNECISNNNPRDSGQQDVLNPGVWHFPAVSVPEPATFAVMAIGLAVLGFAGRRKR